MNQRYLYVLVAGALTCLQPIKAERVNENVNDTIKTYNIGEVIVTSSTKETNDLRTLPGAVSILSPQAIATRQIDALKDISAFVPNLYMPDYGSKMTSAIYIRGIGARSSGQSIGLYVDNVPYLDKSAFDFELNDIQRIEVLRGPQGTLYGRNAMGGIVNIYTLSPFDYQGTKVTMSMGNYGAAKAKVSQYSKIGENIGISLNGYYDRNDGFFINEYNGTKADKEESAGGRFKLEGYITDHLKAQYTFNYDYVTQKAFDDILANNPKAPKLTVQGDELNQIYFPGNFDTPTYGFAAFHQSTYNNLFVEGLSITAGIRLDYEKASLDYHSAVDSMKIGVEMGPMKMTLPVTTTMDGNISQDFLQVLPKVSLRYQCTPETFTYLSVAKGYKTGGYNVQMFGDLVQAQAKYDLMSKFAPDKAEQPGEVKDIASYKPEHSWNYEAGIRSELIRGRLSAELTFFYMDIRDLQLTSFAENGSGRMITNGGKANSYGVELSLRSRITDGLTADLNYGFTRATFRDYIFTDKDENSQIVKTDCKDNFIPYTPRHTVSLGLQYTKLLHRKMVDQFTASAQFTGAGKIFWTEKNDISQPFYGLVNAKVGIRKGIVNLNLWSRNITNTDYQAFYFESFNQSFIQKGKPFQIGGEITVTF